MRPFAPLPPCSAVLLQCCTFGPPCNTKPVFPTFVALVPPSPCPTQHSCGLPELVRSTGRLMLWDVGWQFPSNKSPAQCLPPLLTNQRLCLLLLAPPPALPACCRVAFSPNCSCSPCGSSWPAHPTLQLHPCKRCQACAGGELEECRCMQGAREVSGCAVQTLAGLSKHFSDCCSLSLSAPYEQVQGQWDWALRQSNAMPT